MSRTTTVDAAAKSTHQEVAAGATEPRGGVPDWLVLGLLLTVTSGLALRAAGPITDPDTWWHLRLGEEFRGAWSLGHPGQLSTFATRPWFATQWTLELVATSIDNAFGLAGVAWLAGVAVIVLSVAVYISCRQRGAVLAAVSATAVALVASSLSHGPRPQLASFILVAVFMTAWLRTLQDGRPRWWTVPLTWLWACTHGMWFIGVAIGVVSALGMTLDRRLDRRGICEMFSVPALSLVVAGLTPVGPKLLLAPFATSRMAQFVSEWQPPDFSVTANAAAALMVGGVAATWAKIGKTPWTDILLLAFAVGWILLYARTVPVGAVIAAPLLAGAMHSWLPTARRDRLCWERFAVATAALLSCGGLVFFVVRAPEAPLERPSSVNEALHRLPHGTVVFNEYGLGGWLEWRHRNLVPVIDGMTDAYEVAYVEDYMDARKLKPGWYDFVRSTGANFALFERDSPMGAALKARRDWRVVTRGGNLLLLERSTQ